MCEDKEYDFVLGDYVVTENGLELIGHATRGNPKPDEISRARKFIKKQTCNTKTHRKGYDSYFWKHEAERAEGAYISNGAFIAAMFLEGVPYKHERGLNVLVGLRKPKMSIAWREHWRARVQGP